jgi:hypothetical protein
MWGRVLFGVLLVVTVLAGYPYATLILTRLIGTNTVVFLEQDGTTRSVILGPDAPRPEWLPIPPRAWVVEAGHWLPSPGLEVAGKVELLTHRGVDEIRQFYLTRLGAAGFEMRDLGHGPLDALTAAHLGIDNMLQGYRREAKLAISVTTRGSGGLIHSRLVQINWHSRAEPPSP